MYLINVGVVLMGKPDRRDPGLLWSSSNATAEELCAAISELRLSVVIIRVPPDVGMHVATVAAQSNSVFVLGDRQDGSLPPPPSTDPGTRYALAIYGRTVMVILEVN